MREIEYLFAFKRSEDDFNRVAKNILNKYKDDSSAVATLLDIERRKHNLIHPYGASSVVVAMAPVSAVRV